MSMCRGADRRTGRLFRAALCRSWTEVTEGLTVELDHGQANPHRLGR